MPFEQVPDRPAVALMMCCLIEFKTPVVCCSGTHILEGFGGERQPTDDGRSKTWGVSQIPVAHTKSTPFPHQKSIMDQKVFLPALRVSTFNSNRMSERRQTYWREGLGPYDLDAGRSLGFLMSSLLSKSTSERTWNWAEENTNYWGCCWMFAAGNESVWECKQMIEFADGHFLELFYKQTKIFNIHASVITDRTFTRWKGKKLNRKWLDATFWIIHSEVRKKLI